MAMGGDSGCKYIVGEDYFATSLRDNGFDGLPNMIEVISREWHEFPYTNEERAALYLSQGFGEISNISELYEEMLYLPLTAGKFLLKMDSSLWLAELWSSQQEGPYLWSIYSLVPESAMGAAYTVLLRVFHQGLPVFHVLCHTLFHEGYSLLSGWFCVLNLLEPMRRYHSSFCSFVQYVL
ncbi:MAG: hypothetical protein ACI4NF_00910 [Christensenellales bacterium]